jgi:drug/metabolite transporter (DMT)-like permease
MNRPASSATASLDPRQSSVDTAVTAPNPAVVYLKLILTGILWGGTFIAGRIVAAEARPFSAAFLRFLVASVILSGFLFRSGNGFPRLKPRQWLPVLLLGMSGVFFYNYFFFSGLETISAGRASLIIATNPVFIAIMAAALFREPLTPLKLTGIFLSVCGAMVVITKGHLGAIAHGGIGTGELCIFGCVASWVAYSLIGKVAMRELSPFAAVTYSCLIGMLCLAVPAFHEGLATAMPTYSVGTWLALVYLGLFGSAIGFIWYYQGIQLIGPSRAGVFINIVPVSAIVLAFLILNEPIDGSLIMGTVLVGIGVYFTNRGKK